LQMFFPYFSSPNILFSELLQILIFQINLTLTNDTYTLSLHDALPILHGEKNVEFLKKRYQALSENPLFQGMEFSDDPEKLEEWIPLVMKDRTADEPIAATKIDGGTDVNFGALTSKLLENLQDQDVN